MIRRLGGLAFALALLGPRSVAAEQPRFGVAGLVLQQAADAPQEGELVFAPVGDSSVRAVWYDGDALVLAASRRAIPGQPAKHQEF